MYKYVTSQAINKKKFERRMYDMSDIIMEHLCKLMLHYKDRQNDVNGWIEGISSRLSRVSKFETKGSVRKKYFELSLFASFPVSKSDAEGILLDWNDDLSMIGYDKLSEDYVESVSESFYEVCSDIVSTCITLFTSKSHDKDMKYFNEVIRKAFSDNGVDL